MTNYISIITAFILFFNTLSSTNGHISDSGSKERMRNILFVVRHNKSPNYVVYQVNLKSNNKINEDKPFDVFWLLKNKGGITEDLTLLEWKLAYGFELDEIKTNEEYKIELHALKDKAILVKKNVRGKFLSYMLINNKMAKLTDVFIHYETTFGFPSVQYLDFNGVDEKSGQHVTEKYIPD